MLFKNNAMEAAWQDNTISLRWFCIESKLDIFIGSVKIFISLTVLMSWQFVLAQVKHFIGAFYFAG